MLSRNLEITGYCTVLGNNMNETDGMRCLILLECLSRMWSLGEIEDWDKGKEEIWIRRRSKMAGYEGLRIWTTLIVNENLPTG